MEVFNPALPIDHADGLKLDAVKARSLGEELSGQYCFADPFPHVVIDNFLPASLANDILAHFPAKELASDKFYEDGYLGTHKRQVFPYDCTGFNRDLFGFFNSGPMLEFLEGLSTISGLISDPYFEGGGFHEIFTGGLLGVHADFRVNERLSLQRRMNMLIYLNKNWDVSWGGQLELWDRSMSTKIRSIDPIFNRCVIFNTDADSFHGHPDPLMCPQDVSRKSIALYYYTASARIYEDIPPHSTRYHARPTDGAKIRSEAKNLRLVNQYLRDWLPPALFRYAHRLKRVLRSSSNPPIQNRK